MRRFLLAISAVVAGVVVGLLLTGGGAKRRVAAPPSPPRSIATTVSVRLQSVLAQNHAYVVRMFAGQQAWPLGYQLVSNTGTLAKFNNLVQALESGVQGWLVVHLLFRRDGSQWREIANIPATAYAAIPNAMLARFKPFDP